MSKISKKEIGRCFKLILKALETQVDLITTGDFMSRFCSNLGLPTSAQKAATHIARKAVDLDIVPGRSPISVAAAAIYMASQVCITRFYLQKISTSPLQVFVDFTYMTARLTPLICLGCHFVHQSCQRVQKI